MCQIIRMRVGSIPSPCCAVLSIVIAFHCDSHLGLICWHPLPHQSKVTYLIKFCRSYAGWIIAHRLIDDKKSCLPRKRWSASCRAASLKSGFLTDWLNDFKIPFVVPYFILNRGFLIFDSDLDCCYYQCGQSDWWIRWLGEWGLILPVSDNGDCILFLLSTHPFWPWRSCLIGVHRWFLFPLTTIRYSLDTPVPCLSDSYDFVYPARFEMHRLVQNYPNDFRPLVPIMIPFSYPPDPSGQKFINWT